MRQQKLISPLKKPLVCRNSKKKKKSHFVKGAFYNFHNQFGKTEKGRIIKELFVYCVVQVRLYVFYYLHSNKIPSLEP